MDLQATIVIALLSAILALMVWQLWRTGRDKSDNREEQLKSSVELLKAELISKQTESLMTLRDSIDGANKIINDRLAEGTSSLDRRMSVLGEIENRLGQLAVQATNIEKVGKNIQSLSELLRPPKLRGAVGELLLENLLAQILPPALYDTQHRFSNGLRVDATVTVGDRTLPIDSKFPLESFERLQKSPEDVAAQKDFFKTFRKHVDDIAGKYILPQEDTTDFALMYIPAEGVYHELVSRRQQEGLEYALSKRVIPSSPGHLYAFLSSVASLFAEVSVATSGVLADSRKFLATVNRLIEMAGRLAQFHDRMESSLRALSGGFSKAKNELEALRLQLQMLQDPLAGKDTESESVTAGEHRKSDTEPRLF